MAGVSWVGWLGVALVVVALGCAAAVTAWRLSRSNQDRSN